jgi:hypothetical protein
MKRSLVGLASLALALSASSATAQMVGNPVYVPIGMGTGVSIDGDYGRGLNTASGKGDYFGARVTLGLPFFYVMAGAGTLKTADRQTVFGADVGMNLLDLPLVPVKVSAQAGGGYVKSGSYKQFDVPIAIAIGLSLPTPGVGVTPWIAPRVHVQHTSDTGVSNTDVRFGGSAGINVHFGMLGVHAAVDYISFKAPAGSGLSSSDVSPLVFGIGASLGLTVPGL